MCREDWATGTASAESVGAAVRAVIHEKASCSCGGRHCESFGVVVRGIPASGIGRSERPALCSFYV